jgi:hypothetical protein
LLWFDEDELSGREALALLPRAGTTDAQACRGIHFQATHIYELAAILAVTVLAILQATQGGCYALQFPLPAPRPFL